LRWKDTTGHDDPSICDGSEAGGRQLNVFLGRHDGGQPVIEDDISRLMALWPGTASFSASVDYLGETNLSLRKQGDRSSVIKWPNNLSMAWI
jgi:hypothetical protein